MDLAERAISYSLAGASAATGLDATDLLVLTKTGLLAARYHEGQALIEHDVLAAFVANLPSSPARSLEVVTP